MISCLSFQGIGAAKPPRDRMKVMNEANIYAWRERYVVRAPVGAEKEKLDD